jgi:hypothetical protein
MVGNYAILLCSSLFIILLIFYLSRQTQGIDVLDVFIIFILFHFGVYPFFRGLHFGRDLIFDFTQASPLFISLVFAHVLIILLILKLISIIFLKNIEYLKISYLIDSYSHVNNYVLYSIYAFVIIFNIFSYYKYGVKSYIQPEDFAKIGQNLPYWFTSFRTIYSSFMFCIYLVLLSKTITAKDYKNQILWLALIILFIPFASLYGKRYFVNLLIMTAIFYFENRKVTIFQLRNLKYGFILVVVFFLFSNLFQYYRGILENVGEINAEKIRALKDPLSTALQFQYTLEALGSRPGTWEFSYLVLSKQIGDGIAPTKEILKESFKSAIPRYLWPDKKFSLTDDMLATLYGVRPKEIDIGKNIFGLAQLAFGFLSIIIVPLTIILLLVLMGLLNKITSPYHTFLWLCSANILFYIINIEENGNELFFMLRNILLLSIIFGAFVSFRKIYSFIRLII